MPTLRDVTSRRRYTWGSQKARIWRARTLAALEFAAMARELYGDRTMVFVARDGLPLYWVLEYLVAEEASIPEMKIVSYSGNATSGPATANDPMLSAYFKSQGLAPDDIDPSGAALLDCASGSGYTFFRFRELVDPKAVGHVLASMHSSVPPLRAALRRLDPAAVNMTFREHIGVSHAHWEIENIAHPTGPITGYVEHEGRIEALAPTAAPDVREESLRWKEHVRHQLDGRARRLFARRRPLWSTVRQLAESQDAEAYLELALAQFEERRSDGESEALARDVVQVGLTNFPPLRQQLERRISPTGVEQLWRALEGRDSVRPTIEQCLRAPTGQTRMSRSP
jgi:hypothetical protein